MGTCQEKTKRYGDLQLRGILHRLQLKVFSLDNFAQIRDKVTIMRRWGMKLFKYVQPWLYLGLLVGCSPEAVSYSLLREESYGYRLKFIQEPPTRLLKSLALQNKGYVVEVQDKKVFIDLTAQDGIQRGMPLGVYREGTETELKHPVTGEILATLKNELGTIRVWEVSDKFSVAYLESLVKGEEIRVGDRVWPIQY